MSMNRAAIGLVLAGLFGIVACTDSASKAWERSSVDDGRLSFAHPASWAPVYYEETSTMTHLLTYLSDQPLRSPCRGGSCGWPLDHLAPGGVLISVWDANQLGRVLPRQADQPQVGGYPATVKLERPGGCAEVDGNVTLDVHVDRADPGHYYRFYVCARDPGSGMVIRQVRRMLASVRITGR